MSRVLAFILFVVLIAGAAFYVTNSGLIASGREPAAAAPPPTLAPPATQAALPPPASTPDAVPSVTDSATPPDTMIAENTTEGALAAGASSASPTPEASPSPAAPGPTSDADANVRLQVLLDRAHFSAGEIDGVEGSNQQRALEAYARAKKMAAEQAAQALAKDTSPVLIDYTITAADVAGPFRTVPQEMVDKAKLPDLGFASALEALGEKFHASPTLLKKLNPGAAFDRAGTTIRVPNVHTDALPGKVAKLVVDESDFSVTAFDASGAVMGSYPATMGSEHDPLPLGDWKVTGVSRNPTFNYNPDLFWDSEPGRAKAKIPAGPNNPVGVVWIDLTKPHYGIHGTPEPSKIGKTESHGCIRLTNWDVAELATAVSAGVAVTMQR